jgi:acyl carrier protein
MRTEREIRAALRDWIVNVSGKIEREQLSDETPLIEERIITSLQVMDLILFLEKLSGRPVEVEQLRAGAFRNINTLYQNFFRTTTEAGRIEPA